MAEKTMGVVGTTELRMPSESLSDLFKLTDEGNLIIGNESLAKLISEQAKLPTTLARASTEVSVSVTVRF
jgi:hypothetical protein